MIQQIVDKENRKVSETLTRKKQYLMSKVREVRQDREIEYEREREYLKKKYRNMYRKLMHEQAMEMNQIRMKLFQ